MYYTLDANHNVLPVSRDDWASVFESTDRVVGQMPLLNGCWVSTVFLGLDHNYSHNGPPLVFETMVFDYSPDNKAHHSIDLECRRFSTWAEALADFHATCARVAVHGPNNS